MIIYILPAIHIYGVYIYICVNQRAHTCTVCYDMLLRSGFLTSPEQRLVFVNGWGFWIFLRHLKHGGMSLTPHNRQQLHPLEHVAKSIRAQVGFTEFVVKAANTTESTASEELFKRPRECVQQWIQKIHIEQDPFSKSRCWLAAFVAEHVWAIFAGLEPGS